MKTQKNIMSFIIFSFLTILLFNSCEKPLLGIRGEGEIVTQSFTIHDFTGISLCIDADVYIVNDTNADEIVIEAQQNIIDNIELNVFNNVWEINYNRNVIGHEAVKIFISMDELKKIQVLGTGNIICNSVFMGENLDVEISGTGDVYFNEFIEYNEFDILINGTGNIDFSGSFSDCNFKINGTGDIYSEGITNYLKIISSGTGHLNAIDFECNEAEIFSSGSGDCSITANEELDVRISGTGSVYYKGFPSINVDISGTGRIESLN